MQHLISNDREEDVANEVSDEHLLHGSTEDLDVGPLATLAVVYIATLVLSELLHHNAAVALMFPIAIETSHLIGVDPRGFVMAVASAGCCAFASPVTYQTHLIVYGPGGYRFTDFIRAGLPLNATCALVALALIPLFWPFVPA